MTPVHDSIHGQASPLNESDTLSNESPPNDSSFGKSVNIADCPHYRIREALVAKTVKSKTRMDPRRIKNSLCVFLKVVGINTVALIDTGAEVNLCHERLLELIKAAGAEYVLSPANVKISGVEGSGVQVLGEVRLKLQIADEKAEITAYVCRNLASMLILGQPFWDEEDIELRKGKEGFKQVFFRSKVVQRVSRTTILANNEVRCADLTEIVPGGRKWVKCQTSDQRPQYENFQVNFENNIEGTVGYDMLTTRAGKFVHILVKNVSEHPVIISKDTVLGRAYDIEDDGFVVNDVQLLEQLPLNEDFQLDSLKLFSANEVQFRSDVDPNEEIVTGDERNGEHHTPDHFGPGTGNEPLGEDAKHRHNPEGPCKQMTMAMRQMYIRACRDMQKAVQDDPEGRAELRKINFKKRLKRILLENCSVFSTHDYDIGTVDREEYEVSLRVAGVGDSVKAHPMRYSDEHISALEQEVDNMLQHNVIGKTNQSTEFNLNLLVVKRKSTPEEMARPDFKPRYRIVIDARDLNKRLESPALAQPTIDELLKCLTGYKYYMSLDLKLAFWALQLHPESQKYCSFVFKGQAYSFKRLAMGIVCSPYHLVNYLHRILESAMKKDKALKIYYDDICSGKNTISGLIDTYERVLICLKEHNMKASPAKSCSITTKLKYVGWIMDRNGRRADPKQIETIKNAPEPRSKAQLLTWIGHVSWLRQTGGPDLGKYLRPLHALSTARTRFKWIPEIHGNCFEHIKQLLTTAPVLVPFRDFAPKHLYCDASDEYAGATLQQEMPNRTRGVLTYWNKVIPKQYANWCPVQWELWAIMMAVKSLETYLKGQKVTIYTDNQPSYFILNTKRATLQAQYWRWITEISWLDCEVQYLKGKNNGGGDLPSRIYRKLVKDHNVTTCKGCRRGLPPEAREDIQRKCTLECASDESFWVQLVHDLNHASEFFDQKDLDTCYDTLADPGPHGPTFSQVRSPVVTRNSERSQREYAAAQVYISSQAWSNQFCGDTWVQEAVADSAPVSADPGPNWQKPAERMQNQFLVAQQYLVALEEENAELDANQQMVDDDAHIDLFVPDEEDPELVKEMSENDRYLININSKQGRVEIRERDKANRDEFNNVKQRLPGAPPQVPMPTGTPDAKNKRIIELQKQDSIFGLLHHYWDQKKGIQPPYHEISHLSDGFKYYYSRWKSIVRINGALYLRNYDEKLTHYSDQLLLPRVLAESFMALAHDVETKGHAGLPRMLHELRKNIHYPEMQFDAYFYIRSCAQCSRRRPLKVGDDPTRAYAVGKPNEMIALDSRTLPPSIGGKYRHMLTIMDMYSRFLLVTLLVKECTKSILDTVVHRWISNYGMPQAMLVDRLAANISKDAQRFCEQFDIHLQATSSHHSQGNSLVERSHRTHTDIISKYIDRKVLDQRLVDYTALALNSMLNSGIGCTPLEAMTGRPLMSTIKRMLMQGHPQNRTPRTPEYIYEQEKRLITLNSAITDTVRKKIMSRRALAHHRAMFNRFVEGEYILALTRQGPNSGTKYTLEFTPAVVTRRIDDLHYIVKCKGARKAKKMNIAQLRRSFEKITERIPVSRRDRRLPLSGGWHDDKFFDHCTYTGRDRMGTFQS